MLQSCLRFDGFGFCIKLELCAEVLPSDSWMMLQSFEANCLRSAGIKALLEATEPYVEEWGRRYTESYPKWGDGDNMEPQVL